MPDIIARFSETDKEMGLAIALPGNNVLVP